MIDPTWCIKRSGVKPCGTLEISCAGWNLLNNSRPGFQCFSENITLMSLPFYGRNTSHAIQGFINLAVETNLIYISRNLLEFLCLFSKYLKQENLSYVWSCIFDWHHEIFIYIWNLCLFGYIWKLLLCLVMRFKSW